MSHKNSMRFERHTSEKPFAQEHPPALFERAQRALATLRAKITEDVAALRKTYGFEAEDKEASSDTPTDTSRRRFMAAFAAGAVASAFPKKVHALERIDPYWQKWQIAQRRLASVLSSENGVSYTLIDFICDKTLPKGAPHACYDADGTLRISPSGEPLIPIPQSEWHFNERAMQPAADANSETGATDSQQSQKIRRMSNRYEVEFDGEIMSPEEMERRIMERTYREEAEARAQEEIDAELERGAVHENRENTLATQETGAVENSPVVQEIKALDNKRLRELFDELSNKAAHTEWKPELAQAYEREFKAFFESAKNAELPKSIQKLNFKPSYKEASKLLRENRELLGKLLAIAKEFKMDAALLFSIIAVESRWNPEAKNGPVGHQAYGLMQMHKPAFDDLVRDLGLKNKSHEDLLKDPALAANLGAKYFLIMMNAVKERFPNVTPEAHIGIALALYNQGPNMRSADAKDRALNYVQKVQKALNDYMHRFDK